MAGTASNWLVVRDALDTLEEIRTHAASASDNTSQPTAEDVWWAVMNGRQMRMLTIHNFASQVGAQRLGLVNALFDEFLGEASTYVSFAENLAESAAYRTLRRAGTNPAMELSAISDLIAAALWRANGLPPKFGIGWVNDIRQTRDWSSSERQVANWVRGVEHEVGVLHYPGVSTNAVILALGAVRTRNGRIATVPTPTGCYRLAIPQAGDVWPITFAPGVSRDEDVSGTIEGTVAALLALAAENEGSCWCVEGPGIAIPTSN